MAHPTECGQVRLQLDDFWPHDVAAMVHDSEYRRIEDVRQPSALSREINEGDRLLCRHGIAPLAAVDLQHPAARSCLGNFVAHDTGSTADIAGVNDKLGMLDQSVVVDAIVVCCYKHRVKARYGFRSEGDCALVREFCMFTSLRNLWNEWIVVLHDGPAPHHELHQPE